MFTRTCLCVDFLIMLLICFAWGMVVVVSGGGREWLHGLPGSPGIIVVLIKAQTSGMT